MAQSSTLGLASSLPFAKFVNGTGTFRSGNFTYGRLICCINCNVWCDLVYQNRMIRAVFSTVVAVLTKPRTWRSSHTPSYICIYIFNWLRLPFTYDHRSWNTTVPVRSPIFKPWIGRLVVAWVTSSESRLLYVFDFFFSCLLVQYLKASSSRLFGSEARFWEGKCAGRICCSSKIFVPVPPPNYCDALFKFNRKGQQ